MTHTPYFPVALDLRERVCVVFGTGALARDKADALAAAGARVTRHARAFQPGDLRGAYLAIDASGDAPVRGELRAEADRERVLLNVVDVAEECDWIAPAIVRRGPLQVAVSTSGESPFLASALRARIEAMLPAEWSPFTSLIGEVRRRLRRRGVAADRQRRVNQRLLTSPVRTMLRDGRDDEARALALSIEQRPPDAGEVIIAGTGPGDPDLLTVAAREALALADVVLHDALVDERILRLCRSDARVIDAGKRAGSAGWTQETINATLIDEARSGHVVVRLKGGDPFLFGRGGEEVAALTDAGVPCRVVPGISSALAAPLAAGIPVTHRGLAGSVGIVTGQRALGGADEVERVARAVDTLVVLMPGALGPLSRRLAGVLGDAWPAAIVSAATTPAQQVVRAPLGSIAAAAELAGIEAPATLVAGRVVEALDQAEALQVGPAEGLLSA